MEIKVCKRINYVVEAVSLLERCADSADTISETLRVRLMPSVLERISIPERIVKMAQEEMADALGTIRRYFKVLPQLNFTLADAILLCRHKVGTGTVENIRLYLGEMDEKERANQFINLQIIEEEAVRDDGRAAECGDYQSGRQI